MTFHTLGGAATRCLDLAVELFREINEPGESAAGPKRWHLCEIIARA